MRSAFSLRWRWDRLRNFSRVSDREVQICLRKQKAPLQIRKCWACLLYTSRIRIDQLGKVQPDTRNPVLASELEVLGITENRYSGIPTIRKELEKYHLISPEFLEERGNFVVKFYKEAKEKIEQTEDENLSLIHI